MSRPQFVCGRTQKRSQPFESREHCSRPSQGSVRSPRAMFKFKAKTPSKTPTRPAAADSDDDEDEVQATTARRSSLSARFSLSSGISPTKRSSSSTIDAGERATATLGRRSSVRATNDPVLHASDFLERTDSRSAAAAEDYVLSERLSERERASSGAPPPISAARASSDASARERPAVRASFRRSSTIGAGDGSQESLQSQALQQDMAAFKALLPSFEDQPQSEEPSAPSPPEASTLEPSASATLKEDQACSEDTPAPSALEPSASAPPLVSPRPATSPAPPAPDPPVSAPRPAPPPVPPRPARPTAPTLPGADAPAPQPASRRPPPPPLPS